MQGSELEVQTQKREQAARQVDRFVQRFEPSYRQLAYYAALPLVLTPELLHYLRSQFLRQIDLPWVAEADLLLSDLCVSVGYEQYAMETDVRAYLVAEMEQVLGTERLRLVAKVLLKYVLDLESTNPYLSQQERLSQQMAAMVYVGEAEQEQVAQKLAESYQMMAGAVGASQRLPMSAQAEMARISRLIDELASKLQVYPQLLDFAQVVSQLLTDSMSVPSEALVSTYEVVDGITLTIPEGIRPSDSKSFSSVLSFSGFPPLEPFDFIDAQLVESGDTFPPPLQTEEFTVVTFELPSELLSVEDAEDICKYLSEKISGGELKWIKATIFDYLASKLAETELEITTVESAYSYEEEDMNIDLKSFEFQTLKRPNILFEPITPESENELLVEATLNATVDVTCDFSFSTRTDGEDYGIGSIIKTVEAEIDVDILISLILDMEETDLANISDEQSLDTDLDIDDVEIVEIHNYELNFGMIEPAWMSGDDFDPDDQS